MTGMMKERDWGKAQWIALEKDDPEKNLYPGIHAPLVGKMIGGRKVGDINCLCSEKSCL